MSNTAFFIEKLSDKNIDILTTMTLEMWPECIFKEEHDEWNLIINSTNDYCALAKVKQEYAGFIHISIRNDYVEGSTTNKTPYLEAIYVRKNYRKKNLAKQLLSYGEMWVKHKGFTQLASDTEFDNHQSQGFHKKTGFTEISKIVCYLKNLQ